MDNAIEKSNPGVALLGLVLFPSASGIHSKISPWFGAMLLKASTGELALSLLLFAEADDTKDTKNAKSRNAVSTIENFP
jgi:hypothetical protein